MASHSRPLRFMTLIFYVLCVHGCIFGPDFGTKSGGGKSDFGTDMDAPDLVVEEDLGVPDQGEPDLCQELTCAEGELCINGDCLCGGFETCTGSELCVDFECIAVECDPDNPLEMVCAPAQVCEGFECVDLLCVGDGDCLDGQFCDLEGGICQQGCQQDEDCGGSNEICAQGVCSNVLIDPFNCGELDVICDVDNDSECIDGLCTCGDLSPSVEGKSFSRVLLDSPTDGFMIWPAAELAAYPTADRYRCADSVPLDECERAVFDDGYGLDEPHFVLFGALQGNDNASDRIAVQTLDGRGERIGPVEIYVGRRPDREVRLLQLKVVPFGLEQIKLFALWEGMTSSDRVIVSYSITPGTGPSRLEFERDNILWAEADNITDFSVTLGVDDRSGEDRFVVAIPHTIARGNKLEDGVLSLRGFVFNENNDKAIRITSEDYEVPNLGQILSDFGTAYSVNEDGNPEIHAVILDGTYYPGVSPQANAPFGFSPSYYNRYVFTLDEPDDMAMNAIQSPERRVTVGSTVLNVVELLGALFGDQSILPAPFVAFWDEDSLVTFGWTRVRQMGMDISTYVYRALGDVLVGVEFDNPLVGATVYDSQIAFEDEGSEDVYIYHAETAISGGGTSDNSQLKVAKLITSSPLSLGESKTLSPLLKARRLSVVPGPHATGVLATIKGDGVKQGQAELFFVVDGDEAVCAPLDSGL